MVKKSATPCTPLVNKKSVSRDTRRYCGNVSAHDAESGTRSIFFGQGMEHHGFIVSRARELFDKGARPATPFLII